MRTADDILELAKRLTVDERRRIAEELLRDVDESEVGDTATPDKGPYARWLDAAGTVRSDFNDLSTDKYKHVAAASMHEHDEA
jgi:hypothetical protein